jgi:hypothetical protein
MATVTHRESTVGVRELRQHGDLLALDAPGGRPAGGPPSEEVLAELREDRR